MLKFTGVRLQDSVKAQASLVGARQLYSAYIQRMKRTEAINANWDNLRKKGKATLLASFKADEAALAEACLPDSWDSRSIGVVVTSVKDQGECGTCVAYALAAAAETAILMSVKGSWDIDATAAFSISEDQLYFCSDTKRTCSSGWDLRPAVQFLEGVTQQHKPLYTSACVEYNPDDYETSCKFKCQKTAPKGSFAWEPYDDQLSAQRAIVRYGGVLTYMWLTPDFQAFLSDPAKAKGVFRSQSTVDGVMHAVFVVGYSNSERCWIVKNSFGSQVGDAGYIKVGYGEAGIMEPDRIFGLRYTVDPSDDFAKYAIHLARIPESKDCYIYTTRKGDTLEWLRGRLGLKLSTIVSDNKDVLTKGLSVLAPDQELKLCGVPQDRFRLGLAKSHSTTAQLTQEGYVYQRLDKEKTTFWIFPVPIMSYKASQTLCRKYGGDLATIQDAVEDTDIASSVSYLYGMNDEEGAKYDFSANLWVGYRKPANSKVWLNVDGKTEGTWPYKPWFSDQPKTDETMEQCALYQDYLNNGDKEYSGAGTLAAACTKDDITDMPQGVICSMPMQVAALGKEPVGWDVEPKDRLPVRKGKTRQGDVYNEVTLPGPADRGVYRLIQLKSTLNQQQAQQYCWQSGGNLASIHSKQAIRYLLASLYANGDHWTGGVDFTWLGLRREKASQPFKWYDGTKVDFTNWAFDSLGTEDLVEVALVFGTVYPDAAYFVQLAEFNAEYILCKL